jgi:DNA-binding response OmpR family regulator
MPDNRGMVLVVEDDPAMAELMSSVVEREGFEVLLGANGADALAAHANMRPVAIRLDWELPDRPGSDVCREVRARDPEVIIIFITGRGDETTVARALDAGADDFMVKPVRGGELIARLDASLRRLAAFRSRLSAAVALSPAKATVTTFGKVMLDLGARRLTLDGKPVNLGRLEFALLEYLVKNVGIALSRDQIMKELYGYEADIATDRVDLLARRLRSKLGPGPIDGGWISSVSGYGYRLERRTSHAEAVVGEKTLALEIANTDGEELPNMRSRPRHHRIRALGGGTSL